MTKPIGFTKDVGFQVGARKTFNISKEGAWERLFSEAGLKIWLDEGISQISEEIPVQGKSIHGKIRVFEPYSHIRMGWHRAGWPNETTLQVRVIPSKEKTIISFHQEKLLDDDQRDEMKDYWKGVLEQLKNLLEN